MLFQAVWGGITVLTGLAWWTVAPHMLISLVLLFVAIVVLVRIDETDDPPSPGRPRAAGALTWATVGVLGALCVAGTLVTAAGRTAATTRRRASSFPCACSRRSTPT